MKIDALHQLFLDCTSICTDTRKVKNNCLFFALSGEKFNGNTFANEALTKGAKYAIIDDAKFKTSDNTILVENSLKTLQELATYHREYLGLKIIALTGSNGKTTTKELINVVLSKKYNTTATVGNLNNHIGVPLTLLSMDKNTEIGIVEMGANHKKEIALLCNIAKPDYGYITNFGKAHLEGFGGIEGVIKGKSEMYDYLISNNKLIFYNAEDTIQEEKLIDYNSKVGFSNNNTTDYNYTLLDINPFVTFKTEDIVIKSNLIGAYNFTNLCAASTIGRHFEVTLNQIQTAVKDYTPTNNRSQIINQGSNSIILDAYNANPSSMDVALKNFSIQDTKNKIAILGDMFELGDSAPEEHQNIVNLLSFLDIDKVILVGENFYTTNTENSNLEKYKSFEDFKNNYKTIKDSALLIKGSRGMALERILELL
ncbi:UDP-N-acetylmuramoyl-tripeptide--D-alanyl-D-alanine ligase [Olleya marilimosa]|uniref:UDP-N-acetylmuramoyl-tripeptide--D-alanyl-D-alanine ligase n=1 Tax=Olleya marilimosa TaxID=272164 RepID=A0ABR8LZ63_9FLAO|nr:UDP-N-acetylmuramoyl-tripeptide--D-alanyl-D-alanine ligase [Olleya marilimosa]MBD3864414.1 UDP-N-acetylmuramoyl-tripeptide--D-alanyl-D-alanine ligase [Olleya marilimosa]MBD3891894.1 UDP-N-acetylmuramoyl-tripeptide--D-alanyl-D-alanine ligase [Olleya marilimosa]